MTPAAVDAQAPLYPPTVTPPEHPLSLPRFLLRFVRNPLRGLPRAVYEEMRDSGFTTPQRFDDATILMLDFVGFTDIAISRDPTALITELNDIFTSFDRIVEQFGCERIKTMGDAYMAVSGVPEPTPEHAAVMAETIEQLLAGLTPDERPVIELSLQGYTAQEISEMLGRAERSVRRMRERLRNQLEQLQNEQAV